MMVIVRETMGSLSNAIHMAMATVCMDVGPGDCLVLLFEPWMMGMLILGALCNAAAIFCNGMTSAERELFME